ANRPELCVTVRSDEPLQSAQNRAIDAAYLREQLGRLGNTPYELADVQLVIDGCPFAPSSLLNALRRRAVEQLIEQQRQGPATVINDPLATLAATMRQIAHAAGWDKTRERKDAKTQNKGKIALAPLRLGVKTEHVPAQLHLLVRTPEQLDAAMALRPASITL